MYRIILVEDRITKTKALIVTDKRFQLFVAEDVVDRKTKNIEELESSPDRVTIQGRLNSYQKVYKITDENVSNPFAKKLTHREKKRAGIPIIVNEETRQKMSESHKGELNGMHGRKHSAGARALISARRRNRLHQPHSKPHTIESRKKYAESRKNWKPNVGRKWVHDPYTHEEKMISELSELPPGWYYGRMPAFKDWVRNK